MDKTGFLCKHTSHNAYHRMDYITVSETELFAIVYTTSDNILPTHTSPFSNQHTCTLWDDYTASFTSLSKLYRFNWQLIQMLIHPNVQKFSS